MSEAPILNAEVRDDLGKGASRRLRRQDNKVPAIVYGGKQRKPMNISISQKEFAKHLENEAFYSQILQLKIGDKSENVILKDLQRHPSKGFPVHADFLRISKTQVMQTSVPVHLLNEDKCKGVRLQGGIIAHNIAHLEISCLPADLPTSIDVDLADLELGQIIHISDLQLPEGVTSVALSYGPDHDQPVVAINKPRGSVEDEEEGGEEGEETEEKED